MSGVALLTAHLMFVFMIFVDPLVGVRRHRNLRRSSLRDSGSRVRFYRRSILIQLLWVFGIGSIIFLSSVSPETLGIDWKVTPSAGLYAIVAGLLIALFVPFALLAKMGRRSGEPDFQSLLGQILEPISAQLPNTLTERRLFAALVIVASSCEEVLFRGFLIYYVSESSEGLLNLPVWGTIAASAFVFGMAHLYQGMKGMLSTGLAGTLLASAYVLSGSLLVPIILHTLANLRILAFYRPSSSNT